MEADDIPDEAGEAAKKKLAALHELQQCAGWKLFVERLVEKRDARFQGLTDRSKTPEKRSEHIEGYHDATELLEWLPEQIKSLTPFVRDYNSQ